MFITGPTRRDCGFDKFLKPCYSGEMANRTCSDICYIRLQYGVNRIQCFLFQHYQFSRGSTPEMLDRLLCFSSVF